MAKSWETNRTLSIAFNGWRVVATKMAVMKTRADRLRRNNNEGEAPQRRKMSVLASYVLGESPVKERGGREAEQGPRQRRGSISSRNITGRRRSDVGFLLQHSRRRSISSESVSREVQHISSRTRRILQLQTRKSSVSRTALQFGRGHLSRSEFAKIGQTHRSRRRSSWAGIVRRDFVIGVLDQMTLGGISVERIRGELNKAVPVGDEHVVGKAKFREALVNAGIALPKSVVNAFFDDLDERNRGEVDFQRFLDVLSSHRALVKEERVRRAHLGHDVDEEEALWDHVDTKVANSKQSFGPVAGERGSNSRQGAAGMKTSRSRTHEVDMDLPRPRQLVTEKKESVPRQKQGRVSQQPTKEAPRLVALTGDAEELRRWKGGTARHRRHTVAAIRIQANWRGNRVRLRHRVQGAEMERFRISHGRHATQIQKLYRGYAVRKRDAKQRRIREGRRVSTAKIASM